MTVVGIDDTDSRTRGMCTTYAAHRVAERLRSGDRAGEDDGGIANASFGADETTDADEATASGGAGVERVLLVRLNPAVEFKTRGNAALAVHTDADPGRAFRVAREVIEAGARTGDERTNPGLVVAPGDPGAVPSSVATFARGAVRDHHTIADAEDLLAEAGYRHAGWGNGRGRIGALAAVGAWRAFGRTDGDWTYEHVAYRRPDRRGTPREFDRESVLAAADRYYPRAWDTVDRVEGEAVCFPHTPGPVLYGIRGDDPRAVRDLAAELDTEPVAATELFVTNQGTDAHLRPAAIPDTRDGYCYRVEGVVVDPPETREGGHVFLDLADPDAVREAGAGAGGGVRDPDAEKGSDPVDPAAGEGSEAGDPTAGERAGNPDPDGSGGSDGNPDGPAAVDPPDPADVPAPARLRCAAFEPTKRFRDRVRDLRVGDRIAACGEVADGTLKLEKFAVRALRTTEPATPACPDCGGTMDSAGAGQGYRCRDCATSAPGKVPRSVERDVEEGWYEVPPVARRHVARPLVRGGFDAPTHPER